jgi:hypothetical protein
MQAWYSELKTIELLYKIKHISQEKIPKANVENASELGELC